MSTQSPEYMPTPAPTVSSPSDTSSSPQLNADLSLPYDMSMSSPLAFLLSQNFGNPDVSSSSSSDSPESQDGSPREWAPIMWPEFQGEEAWKWTTQMDLDIFPKQDELVVNPSALHFNPPAAPMVPSAMSLGYPTCPQDILDFSFDALQNFSMNAQSTVPTRPPGLDMAPIAHRSLTPPDDTYSSQATIDDSDDVGRRAREAAGVTIAIQAATPRQLPSATMPDDQAPLKLPIPRLVRPAPAPRSQKTLLAPTSAHTPTLTPAPSPPASAMGSVTPPLGHSGRPKTSHTTIERRYRTNLNARIMALRHAVPALRVLNKEQFPNDIVDERGFVDGVRAARKASKASVLGKAVEYIRVLKRRELRLRRESSGLKSLISGLVGGPALLKEWESGWRSKYGGEEADEIQSDSDGDDEDGDDGSDDEDEKPKKKARVVKEKVPKAPKPSPTVSLPVTGADGEVPGKRKRGRPRKIVAPTEPPASIQPLATQDGGKYMLAVFLFFSFFKSPTTTGPLPEYTAPSTTHLGRVLTSSGLYNATSPTTSFALAPAPVAWSEVIHYIHTIASVLVLISLFLPFLSTYFVLPSLFTRSLKFPVKKDMEILGVLGWAKGERNERSKIARALGCEDPSTLDIVREGSRVAMRTFLSFFGYATTSWSSPAETKAWVRIAQIDLATGMTLPAAHRIHTSLALSNSLAAVPSPSDLATLALLAHPLSSSISTSLWDWANSLGSKQPAEQAVLQLDLTDAENLYRDGLTTSKEQKPLMVAAQTLVMNSLRVSVARAFVSTVNRSLSIESLGLELTDENSLREAVGDSTLALEVGKAVTGRAQQLALLWETYCRHQHLHADITDDMLDTLDQLRDEFEDVGADDDVLSLLRALILFSRVFPASSSSGEDTPTLEGVKPIATVVGARGKLHLDLRRALASAAFDTDGEVEDARDRVVDLLSTMSRRR